MIAVRRATAADLDAVCALGKMVNDHHHAQAPDVFAAPGDAARDVEHWRAAIASDDGLCLVAIDDDRVVGFVALVLHDERHTLMREGRYARVNSIAVAPTHRGRGIGRALMIGAERGARDGGATELRLNVWTFNDAAIALYRSLGLVTRTVTMGKTLTDERGT